MGRQGGARVRLNRTQSHPSSSSLLCIYHSGKKKDDDAGCGDDDLDATFATLCS